MSPDHNAAPTDFDAISGRWRVAHRRLNPRPAGCTGWTNFSGTSTTRKVLEGCGSVKDNVLEFPNGPGRALALHSFDPESRRWATGWLDGRSPHQLDVPVIGGCTDGIGEFIVDDTMADAPSACASAGTRIRERIRGGRRPSRRMMGRGGKSIGRWSSFAWAIDGCPLAGVNHFDTNRCSLNLPSSRESSVAACCRSFT